MNISPYKAVVMGASAGGLPVLKTIFSGLPPLFPLPIAIVQHMREQPESFLADYLSQIGPLKVKEAEDKEPFRPG
ncbi:MAG TPA: chemotaxis protein CheB, partial [Alphaproteobacteria bacterium]|nr:chemotaxis protein CheB [Alphaproteobacteria bacterium]